MANTCFLGQAHQRETLKAPLAVVLTLPVHPERAESSGAKGIQPVCQHQNESELPTLSQPTAPASTPSLLPGDLEGAGYSFSAGGSVVAQPTVSPSFLWLTIPRTCQSQLTRQPCRSLNASINLHTQNFPVYCQLTT